MDVVRAWAGSGAMALTGRAGGPGLGPPAPLVPRLVELGEVIASITETIGRCVELDTLALLGERAAISGLTRNGTVSCGGATRLLPTIDGWVALSLARREDTDLLPAWLGVEAGADPWSTVSAAFRGRASAELVASGAELGLPVSALGERTRSRACARSRLGDHAATRRLEDLTVVDLTSLWAGPLCGSLLAAAGADVWKVETTERPDGARFGPAAFYDLLNARKRPVAVPRAELLSVVAEADVVLEASRPRALEQLGIDAAGIAQRGRPRVWVSITAHGRRGRQRERVGFGDDAAVAGGLVAWEEDQPRFCADAIADPLSGLEATAACLAALAEGGRWLLDVSMSAVAAQVAGPTLNVPPGIDPLPPRSRTCS